MIASPVYTEPLRVAQIMADFRCPWFVCGGWAIDLFINRVSRQHQPHLTDRSRWEPVLDQVKKREISILFPTLFVKWGKDVDIGIWRPDQLALRAYLVAHGWTPAKAIDIQRLPWPKNEFISLPMHAISCKNSTAQPSRIEVLFNEASNAYFQFRRDLAIIMPLADAIVQTKASVPILVPGIVLLYKAKDLTREDNRRDFETALPHLNPTRRAWLQAALLRMHFDHEWLERL